MYIALSPAIHRRPRYPPPWVTAPSKDGYALDPARVQADLSHFFERDKNVIKTHSFVYPTSNALIKTLAMIGN
jgi:hypothetical protein